MYSSWALSESSPRRAWDCSYAFLQWGWKGERVLKSFSEYAHRGDTRAFARINRRQHERPPKARWINYYIPLRLYFAIVAKLLARRSYVSITARHTGVTARCYSPGRNVSAKRSDRTRKNPRRRSYKGFEKKAEGMSARAAPVVLQSRIEMDVGDQAKKWMERAKRAAPSKGER